MKNRKSDCENRANVEIIGRIDMPVLGLAGCHRKKIEKKQVRFHGDRSSFACAIYAPTGPLQN